MEWSHYYIVCYVHYYSTCSTGNSSQSIWFDDLDCPSSTYNCIGNCAGCPSTGVYFCDHYEDITIECSK